MALVEKNLTSKASHGSLNNTDIIFSKKVYNTYIYIYILLQTCSIQVNCRFEKKKKMGSFVRIHTEITRDLMKNRHKTCQEYNIYFNSMTKDKGKWKEKIFQIRGRSHKQ